MKVASLIAHTAAGWHPLAQGENIPEIKQQFKDVKVSGVLCVGDLAADCVMYFDTSGAVRRKKLTDPESAALVAGLNERSEAEAAAAQAVVDEAQENARVTAERVVQVVRDAVAPLAVAPAPVATAAAAPESAPAVAPISAPVAEAAAPGGDESEDETPADHFGGRRGGKAKK